MKTLGIIIAVTLTITLIGVVYMVVVKRVRHGKTNPRLDQSEWYDADGNHRYYDRKYLRQIGRCEDI